MTTPLELHIKALTYQANDMHEEVYHYLRSMFAAYERKVMVYMLIDDDENFITDQLIYGMANEFIKREFDVDKTVQEYFTGHQLYSKVKRYLAKLIERIEHKAICKAHIDYDPKTGIFTHEKEVLIPNTNFKRPKAVIHFCGTNINAARLAYELQGYDIENYLVVFKDADPTNTKFENLKALTPTALQKYYFDERQKAKQKT